MTSTITTATIPPSCAGSMARSETTSARPSKQISHQTYKIITQYGDMRVVKQSLHIHTQHHQPNVGAGGNQQQQGASEQQQQHSSRPIIMTFHDLGLNSELQFATFCETEEVKLMLETFTMIHVNFIGQEADNNQSENLADDFKYPNIDQMAECIVDVCTQLRVRSFVALAVGAGAHIVSSLALMRPDLVQGLFLINPIISNCSITEWLYFKMSAFASNHCIGGSSGGGGGTSSVGASSADSASLGNHSSGSSNKHHTSGFRKLLSAAHIQLQHHEKAHDHTQLMGHGSKHDSSKLKESTEELGSDRTSCEQTSAHESGEIPNFNVVGAGRQHGPTTSRLRRLILSRNFRTNKLQRSPASIDKPAVARRQQAAEAGDGRFADSEYESDHHGPTSKHGGNVKVSSHDSTDSIGAEEMGSQVSQTGAAADACIRLKRAPYEYLMYHHFGSASIQRCRRPSAEAHHHQRQLSDSPRSKAADQTDKQSNSSRQSSQSQESLTTQTPRSSVEGGPRKHRGRSSSTVCLNATYLATFQSDRQRTVYMQSVYKHYFTQINAHNLWLFAQSFVKRRALNLRKDCGAAAHAAAAAAALGTSICTAFVGATPQQQQQHQHGKARDVQTSVSLTGGVPPTSSHKNEITSAGSAPLHQPELARRSNGGKQSNHKDVEQKALVAGTKVKRTFTCQTLIMCSNVPVHCERAFKLMSLLNPLQATCIKTDQLLVLEEKPEKVCQALRLFLQGIGYSMSTYERRLRLNSAHGSASSADSAGSTRSLTTEKL